MSFFKKMTKEFDELKSTFTKNDEKKEQKHGETHDSESSQHDRQAQPYGQPPYDQGAHYGGAPPLGPPSMDPSLPPGWIKEWDSNRQRWFFVEQASGRTQWEPPMAMSQNSGNKSAYPPQGGQYDQHHDPSHKDKGHGNMMGAAAGGLAVGAVGGALAGHAMGDDSDSDHGAPHYAAQPSSSAYGQPPMEQHQAYRGDDPSAPPMQGDLPDETRSGSSVSGSDKEDVEEAREEYQEELKEGSQSDIEEAREEYEEQYEETYDD